MKLLHRLATARVASHIMPQLLNRQLLSIGHGVDHTAALLRSSRSGARTLYTSPLPQRQQHLPPSRLLSRRLHFPRRNQHTSPNSRPTSTPPPPQPPPREEASPNSLSARLRKLSREYGWSAFGVYMLLTALDFPFCFLAVRYIGPARVGHAEHVIVSWIESVIPEPVKEGWRGLKEQVKGAVQTARGEEEAAAADGTVVASTPTLAGDGGADVALVQDGYADHGVIEAEAENAGDNASIWTQLALAYAIHKSFIFIRVPLTVAVTPKVVKVLRGWGWDIGRRPATAAAAAAAARSASKKAVASTPKS